MPTHVRITRYDPFRQCVVPWEYLEDAIQRGVVIVVGHDRERIETGYGTAEPITFTDSAGSIVLGVAMSFQGMPLDLAQEEPQEFFRMGTAIPRGSHVMEAPPLVVPVDRSVVHRAILDLVTNNPGKFDVVLQPGGTFTVHLTVRMDADHELESCIEGHDRIIDVSRRDISRYDRLKGEPLV